MIKLVWFVNNIDMYDQISMICKWYCISSDKYDFQEEC